MDHLQRRHRHRNRDRTIHADDCRLVQEQNSRTPPKICGHRGFSLLLLIGVLDSGVRMGLLTYLPC
jgi:hypothetical protein